MKIIEIEYQDDKGNPFMVKYKVIKEGKTQSDVIVLECKRFPENVGKKETLYASEEAYLESLKRN